MGTRVANEDILILALAGKSQTQIAETLHLTKATVCRRMHRKDFTELLSEHRKRRIDTALTSLSDCVEKAVETLKELMDSESDFIRLSAAGKILQITQDYSIQHDLLSDIEKLKEMQTDSNYL